MKRTTPLALLLCLLPAADTQPQTIYTWTDHHGTVHFSDNPSHAHSRVLRLSVNDALLVNDTPPALTPSVSAATAQVAPKQHTTTQTELHIEWLKPTHEQTVHDNQGNITLHIALNRPLSEQETLQLLLDDQPFGAPGTKTVWQLSNIARGSHTFLIQALVSGKVIASSSKVTVYLHRASIK
ncbi:DUF4124 domain-containing protein [Vibrio sp. ABG19]|uniref:DUF4124 domain-containing protein n=1 Tax=Vibrio sp. ABG19 TaxID=2817385 RepID=UPI00249DC056|nr:DUF4124 domain-containing protein [Vibrio sp. ABG19]WGY48164.1 DUF4124 domain-containing protein [Vibrio sp. ABG19]